MKYSRRAFLFSLRRPTAAYQHCNLAPPLGPSKHYFRSRKVQICTQVSVPVLATTVDGGQGRQVGPAGDSGRARHGKGRREGERGRNPPVGSPYGHRLVQTVSGVAAYVCMIIIDSLRASSSSPSPPALCFCSSARCALMPSNARLLRCAPRRKDREARAGRERGAMGEGLQPV